MRVDERLLKLLRWLRRLGTVAVVVLMALMIRWYDFEKLADEQWEALRGKVRRGAFLVFGVVDEDTVLGAGSIVEARVTVPPKLARSMGRREGAILSEVRAVPGSMLTFKPAPGGMMELQVDGELTGARFDPAWQEDVAEGLKLREGPLPDGCYLLINPAVDAEAVDSRKVGLVTRDALLRKASHL